MQLAPVGVPGELYVAGPGLAVGYLNRPELTAECFLANPFSTADEGVMYKTGDRVRWRPDGELEFLGRLDQQLKIRGYRVEPEEIQEVLRRHADIADALVVTQRGKHAEAALAAYVVPRSREHCSLADVRAYLREHLPHYMVPASIMILESFPLNVSGKIDRALLPEITSENQEPRAFAEPRTRVEKLLAGIWQRVLGGPAVGIHDNFFDLGGASIQTLEVVTLANQAGLAIAPEMIFRYQTIADLARACTEIAPTSVPIPVSVDAPPEHALTRQEPPARQTQNGGAVVESLGCYLPPREVTTEQVLADCRVKLDFPLKRMTGIHARRMAGDTEFAIDLAARAVADCLARSAHGPLDIDLLICCNISRFDGPNHRLTMEPTTAARLRAQFGFSNATAFDVSNACAGTFTAIHLVDTLLREGVIRRAMVVSGEYITHLTRTAQREIESFMDPRLACLTLGDSGMAMILEQAPSQRRGLPGY